MTGIGDERVAQYRQYLENHAPPATLAAFDAELNRARDAGEIDLAAAADRARQAAATSQQQPTKRDGPPRWRSLFKLFRSAVER